MRVLLVSKFLHHVGGVETYLRWLAAALQNDGHDVALLGMSPPDGHGLMDFGEARVYTTPTRQFVDASTLTRARSALSSVYSRSAGAAMTEAIRDFAPDVIHYHGTCYQLTSAVVTAAQGCGARRLLTAHEYKLACANQRLWDDSTDTVCTRCVGVPAHRKLTEPVRTSCIKSNRGASVIGGLEAVLSRRVWRSARDVVIHTPSRFMAATLVRDGWSADRIHTIDLPWAPGGEVAGDGVRNTFLYMGRLAVEKDVITVLRAWHTAREHTGGRELHIAGDGAAGDDLRQWASTNGVERVRFLGRLDRDGVQAALAGAVATVHPAAWFENSPFAVRESLVAGVPAMVADVGGMPELVRHGSTGVVVQHSVPSWTSAFTTSHGILPSAGDGVRSAAIAYATTERAHLDAILGLYTGRVDTGRTVGVSDGR